jgi:hypothetical protein
MQDTEDEPLFAERVAGLDIAKAGVDVAIRVPSDSSPGRRQQETRAFGTTRRELLALADWLRCWGVTKVGMEATTVIRGFQDRQRCIRSSTHRGRVRDRSSDDGARTNVRRRARAHRGNGQVRFHQASVVCPSRTPGFVAV